MSPSAKRTRESGNVHSRNSRRSLALSDAPSQADKENVENVDPLAGLTAFVEAPVVSGPGQIMISVTPNDSSCNSFYNHQFKCQARLEMQEINILHGILILINISSPSRENIKSRRKQMAEWRKCLYNEPSLKDRFFAPFRALEYLQPYKPDHSASSNHARHLVDWHEWRLPRLVDIPVKINQSNGIAAPAIPKVGR